MKHFETREKFWFGIKILTQETFIEKETVDLGEAREPKTRRVHKKWYLFGSILVKNTITNIH